MKNEILNEVKEEMVISKKEFEKYFEKKNIINVEQYKFFIKTKSGKSREK